MRYYVLLFVLMMSVSFAYSITLTSEIDYIHIASSEDTALSSGVAAYEEAVKKASGEFSVQLKNDLAIREAEITGVELATVCRMLSLPEVMAEEWDGRGYRVKIRFNLDTDTVLSLVKDLKQRFETEGVASKTDLKSIILRSSLTYQACVAAQKRMLSRKNSSNMSVEMILVEGGTFHMGSSDGEDDEKPVHEVIVDSFWIGKYEVTQKEWQSVMGTNPSKFKGENNPVERVSWHDAVKFCNQLSLKDGLEPVYRFSGEIIECDFTKNGYRLPTEAEWEYAARGGQKSLGYKYAGSNNAGSVAWYYDNSGGKTHRVGTKQPNELGLYDMSGNVWEWCWDWYGEGYYLHSLMKNPRGPSSGPRRVLRGGGWGNYAEYVRSAFRGCNTPSYSGGDLGFRLSRTVTF